MATIEFKEVFNYDPKSRDKKQNEAFRNERVSHSKKYKEIGSFATGASYYKYFPIATAIKCLESGTMAFVEPSRWNDAYESLFYEANYSLVSPNYKDHPRVFATCATNKKYDEPAWRIYSGEDNVCVQFELDRFKLRFALLKVLDDNDSIYEGMIQYTSKYVINNIDKKKRISTKTGLEINNKFYDEFVAHNGKPFNIDNFLNLLLLKRDDFEHEKETRFFIIKNMDVVNEAEKAKETPTETSDATKREIVVNRGEVLVLRDINWIDILKSITINVESSSMPYGMLKKTIDQLIDNKIIDPVLKAEYKKKLEPVSYLVYGTKPPVLTIEG
jgi:hypothetical protein